MRPVRADGGKVTAGKADISPSQPAAVLPAPAAKLPRGRPSAVQSAALTRSIVDVATRLFLSQGFNETSMEAIAAEARIPKNTLYKRYADKGALARAVIASQVAAWSATASRSDDRLPDELGPRLAHYVATMLLWSTRSDVRAVMRLAAAIAPEGARGRPDVDAYRTMRDHIVRAIVELGPGSGVVARDPERVASALMALVSGWLETLEQVPATRAEAAIDAAFLVDLLIRGRDGW